MPALLMRISIPGVSLSVSATARVTEAMSATSTTTASQQSPAAVLCAAAASRSQIVMLAPEAASRSAIAKPMPDAPPVTTAWRPLRSSWFMAPLPCGGTNAGVSLLSAEHIGPHSHNVCRNDAKEVHAEVDRPPANRWQRGAQIRPPLVRPGDAHERRARPRSRRLHLEGPQTHRRVAQALGRAQQTPQGGSVPLGAVDAGLLSQSRGQ